MVARDRVSCKPIIAAELLLTGAATSCTFPQTCHRLHVANDGCDRSQIRVAPRSAAVLGTVVDVRSNISCNCGNISVWK